MRHFAWLVFVFVALGCKGLQARARPQTTAVTSLEVTLAESSHGRLRCSVSSPTADVKEVVWEFWLDATRLAAGVQSVVKVTPEAQHFIVTFDAPLDLRVFPFKAGEVNAVARLKGRLMVGPTGGAERLDFSTSRDVKVEGRPVLPTLD